MPELPMTLAVTVNVCSGCFDKPLRVSGLQTVEMYLAQFWRLGVQDEDDISVLCNEVFLPQKQLFSTLSLTAGRGKDISTLFYRIGADLICRGSQLPHL